jgi:hypothetical protein
LPDGLLIELWNLICTVIGNYDLIETRLLKFEIRDVYIGCGSGFGMSLKFRVGDLFDI